METKMLQKVEPTIRPMEYRLAFAPAVSSAENRPEGAATEDASAGKKGQEEFALLTARLQELEEKLREQESGFRQRLEAETAAAFERGRKQEDTARTAAWNRIAEGMRDALGMFAAARDSYLAQVEQEVVRLALSIAARILHREAQMDPLLLSGAVRVALGQLSDSTEVRLRVPAAQHSLWSELIQLMPNLPLRPQLVADEGMQAGECALETHLGSVDLGVKAQLEEIERGFFDLLERRDPLQREAPKAAKADGA